MESTVISFVFISFIICLSSTQTTSTSGTNYLWNNLRLPTTVIPLHYDLILHPNTTTSSVVGIVKMSLWVAKATDIIVFHANQIRINTVSVKYSSWGERRRALSVNRCSGDYNVDEQGDNNDISIIQQMKQNEYQQYQLKLSEQLKVNRIIIVTVTYAASLAGHGEGFYKSEYTVDGQQKILLNTNFEPNSASRAFPCLDEPTLKATFTLKIIRRSDQLALFNTELMKTTPYNYVPGFVSDEFKQTVCMSTYLVAFVIADNYTMIENTTDEGLLIRIIAPSDKINMAQYALDSAVKVIKKYTSYFGISYPISKLDMIAIPNFGAGAMENWGLVMYQEKMLLFDPATGTTASKKQVAKVLAHELAHQWFGNLVTMKWWNDIWLNEGFATYMEIVGSQAVDTSFHMLETIVSTNRGTMKMDGLTISHPIQVKVVSPSQIQAAFNDITYNKGSQLIQMLNGAIGTDAFNKGLQYYLNTYQFNNAEQKDLWVSFGKFANLPNGLTMPDFMNTWTQQMGYPVVTVSRNSLNINLVQERFLLTKEASNYTWVVPFTYKTSSGNTATTVWLNNGNSSLQLPSSDITWLKGNVDATGWYRVNYDSAGWKAISNQLQSNHTVFSVMDRVSLVDDAFEMAKSGRLNYKVVLDLCNYLGGENDYFVWSLTLTEIKYILNRMNDDTSLTKFKSYILKLTKPLFDSVKWENTGELVDKLLRQTTISLGIELNYGPIVTTAKTLFSKWKVDENVALNKDLRQVIINAGVQYGTKADWDLVYKRYQSSKSEDLLTALAASTDATLLQTLLKDTLDTTIIPAQSTITVLSDVAANPKGYAYTWQYVKTNWDSLFEQNGNNPFSLPGILRNIMGRFNNQNDLVDVQEFFKGKQLGIIQTYISEAIEVLKVQTAWKGLYLNQVKAWLNNNA